MKIAAWTLCLSAFALTNMAVEALDMDFLRGPSASEKHVETAENEMKDAEDGIKDKEDTQGRRLPFKNPKFGNPPLSGRRGKGKGKGKGGGGKGRGRGGGGRGGRGPAYKFVHFGFEQDPFTYAFDQFGSDDIGALEALGSTFIWDGPFYNETGHVIGTTTGTCTRVRDADSDFDPDGGPDPPSLGVCRFVYTDMAGNGIIAEGEVVDGFGGTLAITGGTNKWTGASGEVDIFPLYDPAITIDPMFDLFLDAIGYDGNITFAVPQIPYGPYGYGY